MKKTFALLLILMLISISAFSQKDTFFSKTNSFLKKYVSDNKVDYFAIKTSPNELDDLVKIIANYDLTTDENSNKAFLINAYNLLVLKGITIQFPVKSPLDIAGFFDKTIYTISGKKITLNDIENKMLRAKYNDARLHFVLVCGANGCPPIIAEAYLPETLDAKLDQQTSIALNNPNFIKVKGDKIQLSQLFEWYKADFKNKEIEFINSFREAKINPKTKFSYYPYDWSLNKK
ncbi:MAG: DUF547 domain-containing protein [Flavobacterium micromati]|nr:DUF547 domain-containing protein [Flavobacterium micromati]